LKSGGASDQHKRLIGQSVDVKGNKTSIGFGKKSSIIAMEGGFPALEYSDNRKNETQKTFYNHRKTYSNWGHNEVREQIPELLKVLRST